MPPLKPVLLVLTSLFFSPSSSSALFGPHLFSPQPSSWLPDPLHAYLGLCGLSLIGEPTLRKVHPALNVTQRAFQHLQQLQQTWKDRTDSCGRRQWQRERRPLCARAAPSNKSVGGNWNIWSRVREASLLVNKNKKKSPGASDEPWGAHLKSSYSDFCVKQYATLLRCLFTSGLQ